MLNRIAFCLFCLLLGLASASADPKIALPKIGLLVPLTGTYQQPGAECLAGYQVISSLQNPGRTVVADSQADGKVSTTEFKRLVEIEHVDAVVLMRSPVGMAVNLLSKQSQIPLLGLVANPRFVTENPYAMQFWPAADEEGALLADEAISRGLKKTAIFTAEDEWLIPLADAFRKQFEKRGGEVQFSEQFAPTEMESLPSLLARAKQSSPALLTFFSSIQQIPVLIRRSRDLGLEQPVFTLWWAQNPEIAAAAMPKNMHDVSYSETDFSFPEFLNEFSAKNKQPPTAATFLCYLAARAIEQAGSSPSFRDNLLKLSSIKLSSKVFPIEGRLLKVPVHLRTVVPSTK